MNEQNADHRFIHECETQIIKKQTHLFDSQAFLMHVAQVKHGLGSVLLLGCQSVVNDGGLVVHIRSISVKVIVS